MMNTKTTKFLAVLAVLAMAFAAFAVVTTNDDSDAYTLNDYKTIGEFKVENSVKDLELTLKGQPTLDAVYTSGLTNVSGYTTNAKLDGTAYPGAKYTGSALFNLVFPAMGTGYDTITGISVTQTSTAVAALLSSDLNANQALEDGVMTSWFLKSTFASENDFEMLVPQDGTGIVLVVALYNNTDFDPTDATKRAVAPMAKASYVINLEDVTTVVNLSADADVSSLIGNAEGGWTYANSGDVLTLNNFEGQVAFLGKITTVSLIGTNQLEADVFDASSDSSLRIVSGAENGVLSSSQAMTIKTSATATKAYLTVTNTGKGFGISTTGSLTIGDTSGTAGALNTDITVDGGNRGVYSASSMTIDNATLRATGSERAIHVYSDSQTMTISGGSVVAARLVGSYLNEAGDDDIFAVKIGRGAASTYGALTLSEGSTLAAQGLRVTGTITLTANDGTDLLDRIYVASGYTQNPIAKLTVNIAGLYLDQMTGTLTIKKQSEPKTDDAQGVYFIGDVDYYTPKMTSVTVTDAEGGQSSYQANATDANGITSAIAAAKTAGVKETIVNVTNAVTGLNATLDAGKEIELRTTGEGAVSGNIQLGVAANTVGLTNFTGNATFTNGSIVMKIVEWTGGNVVLTDGDVLKITGSSATIAGNVKIIGPEEGSATVLIDDGQTLTINSGSKLSISGNVKMNNDGALIGGGYIDVAKPSTFYSSKPVSVYFSGDGTILIDDATETVYLSGKYISQNTYTPTQKVIVNENLTIEKNAFIIIKGGLVVPAGVTITIQDGGYLMLDDTTAYADIDGDIKSSSALGFVVTDDVDGDVEISGNVFASKASTDDVATVSILGEATLSGTLTVNAKAEAVFGKLTITEDGAMIVNGAIFGEFYNEGSVTINGSVDAGAIIHTAAADAVVKIDALKAGDLTITDAGMYLRTVDGVRETVSAANANIMTFSNVMGVTVTEDIVFYMWDDVQYVYNATYLDGVLTVADKKSGEQPSVTISNGSNNYVIGELTVTQAFVYIEEGAKLSVIGKAYIENTEYVGFVTGLEVEIGGALEVSGLLRSATEEIDDEDYITAVKYSVMDGATQYYYYTNLADAIASGAKDLTVLGTLKISKDTTIPAGFDVDASGKTVNVGSATNTEVTLTVAKGGSLSAKTINVYGTLYVEDVDTGIACNNIISDVSNISDDDAVYTNIYYALSTATLGDVVKITNKDGKVVLKRDATVPFGVTLLVPANEILGIQVGQTLTVAGELEVKGAVNAYNKDGTAGAFAEKADATHAAIAVTGFIESLTNMPFGTYYIPGAYYTYKTLYCITSLANSALIINDAEGQLINVYGDKMAYGNVAYEGTATKPVTVNINDSVASGTITISYGTINLIATENYDMTIAGDNGSVKLAGVKVTTAAAVLASEKDGYETIAITKGVFALKDKSVATSAKMTFDGDFTVSGSTIYKPTAKGDLVLSGNVTISGTTTVSGSLTVDYGAVVATDDGAAGTATANVTVTGSLLVLDATTTKAAGKMTVDGSLIAGASLSNLVTSAEAIVTGDITATKAYFVFDGATLYGKVTEAIQTLIDAKKFTAFYVEDDLLMTVYAVDTTAIKYADYTEAAALVPAYMTYYYYPKELGNCDFVEWQYKNSSGEYKTISGKDYTVGMDSGYTAIYALINYNIYDVTVVTDAGIKAVSIDGIQMVSNGINQFTSLSPLIAGTHTITYTLKDGYEESTNGVILYTEDGIILKDHKFIADGTETEDRDITLQLSGTQKEVAPEPEPTPEPEKESEWNVTTILLLVLVILIAIMAVIVALRLNRN
jgi:hypothetical protein